MATTNIKAKREHAGYYTYTLSGYTVRVEDRDPNPAFGDTHRMWMAIAEWTPDRYSDPLDTKREAVESAHAMLREAVGFR